MDAREKYIRIIENSLNNPPSGYTEKHHIIPRSLGGTNKKSNLIKLTALNHFKCHELLIEMYPQGSSERQKMIYALHLMAFGNHKNEYEITAEQYEKIRKLFSIEKRKSAKLQNQKTVNAGLHPFQGGEIQRKTNKRLIDANQHNWQDSNNAKKRSKQRIESDNHPFLNKKIQSQNSNNYWANISEKNLTEHKKRISIASKKRWAKWRQMNGRNPKVDDWKFL